MQRGAHTTSPIRNWLRSCAPQSHHKRPLTGAGGETLPPFLRLLGKKLMHCLRFRMLRSLVCHMRPQRR